MRYAEVAYALNFIVPARCHNLGVRQWGFRACLFHAFAFNKPLSTLASFSLTKMLSVYFLTSFFFQMGLAKSVALKYPLYTRKKKILCFL